MLRFGNVLVPLNVGENQVESYARRNLAHTNKASVIINALEPKSKPEVEAVPTGEAS